MDCDERERSLDMTILVLFDGYGAARLNGTKTHDGFDDRQATSSLRMEDRFTEAEIEEVDTQQVQTRSVTQDSDSQPSRGLLERRGYSPSRSALFEHCYVEAFRVRGRDRGQVGLWIDAIQSMVPILV